MHARRVIQGESTEVMNTEMSPFPPMGGRGTTVVCSRLTSPIVVRGIAPGIWGSWGTELGDPDPSLKDTTGTPPIYSLSSRAGELELDRTGKKEVWLVMFDNKKITNNLEKKCNINWCNLLYLPPPLPCFLIECLGFIDPDLTEDLSSGRSASITAPLDFCVSSKD